MEVVLKKKNLENFIPIFDKISHITFALGLLIELTIVMIEKSEYIIQYEGLWFRVTFLLFGISLITTRHHWKEWVWLFLLGIVGIISYKVTGRNEVIRWLTFIWACRGKDMKKVLKFTFWYTLLGCAVLVILSVSGIYGTMYLEAVYRPEFYGDMEAIERRYCFGMGHPNSFHCMILVITWLGIYSYSEKIKWKGYLAILLVNFISYYFTGSRTGLLMSIGTVILTIFAESSFQKKKEIYPYFIGVMTIIAAVCFSIYMAKYSINAPFLQKLDGFLTGRIQALMDSYRDDGMLNTWFLWSEEINDNYFDLGIVRMFYWYGIIPAGIYFLMQLRLLWCGYKKKDYMLAVILSCITLYSIFEAHFISDYMGRNYILFFFGMYLADMIGSELQSVTGEKKR